MKIGMNGLTSFLESCRSFFKNVDILGIIFPLLMIVPNILLDITESTCILGKIANILVPLSIYYLLMSSLKRVGVTVLLLFIMILMNSFQIVVLYLYGESIIAVDMLLNCLTTNPSEASELLSNLSFPILCDAVIYIPAIGWAIYSVIKKLETTVHFRKQARKFGLYGLIAGIAVTILSTATDAKYDASRDLYPFNVISNIVAASKRTAETVNYDSTSADFRYNAEDTHPVDDREIYVLVIGETSRAMNWELFGYGRPTNPRLSHRRDLALFPRAISQSNTTHKCVPMMLTHTTPESFDSIKYRKSIVTAFKEAGYRTSFFSNQPKNHSYTQFFSEEADKTLYLNGRDHFDQKLVELMKRQICDTAARKQLIILHAYGSHFNYKERYPDSLAYFRPDAASEASIKHRQQLLNAYDNTIRYTDGVIADIIEALVNSGSKCVMLYTSDHGEDIFDDDRERFLHASPIPTYYQIHVPLIIWADSSYTESYPDKIYNLNRNSNKYVAPSQAVFFTLLDLAGIKTDYNSSVQSVASAEYMEPTPLYLTDLNESVPLEESGLKQCDIKNLRRIGVIK